MQTKLRPWYLEVDYCFDYFYWRYINLGKYLSRPWPPYHCLHKTVLLKVFWKSIKMYKLKNTLIWTFEPGHTLKTWYIGGDWPFIPELIPGHGSIKPLQCIRLLLISWCRMSKLQWCFCIPISKAVSNTESSMQHFIL